MQYHECIEYSTRTEIVMLQGAPNKIGRARPRLLTTGGYFLVSLGTPHVILNLMTRLTCDVFICGAGITGVAAAYFLSRLGVKNILLADERPPLSLTSDRSAECYRNWWPDASMLGLMNRSIDWLEKLADESGNVFQLNRRGYLYLTADPEKKPALTSRAQRTSALGAGPLRIHNFETSSYQPAAPDGFHDQPDGADLLLDPALIHKIFPHLSEKVVAALHVRRAGWLSAQQLGMYLLDQARSREVRYLQARVTGMEMNGERIQAARLSNGDEVEAGKYVIAAGPFLREVGRMFGLEIPVATELHQKAAIRDNLGIVPRQAPLLIWDDPQALPWRDDERMDLAGDDETRWLTDPFPSGVHARPEGSGDSQTILMLWEYQTWPTEPVNGWGVQLPTDKRGEGQMDMREPAWPPRLDERFPEIALRGLATMLPGMRGYFDKIPRPQLDGGYYTRTRENRPLVGPLPVKNAYVIGAVSGYGIMSACGTGELLAAHVASQELPPYAPAFMLERYNDVEYLKQITNMDSGQL